MNLPWKSQNTYFFHPFSHLPSTFLPKNQIFPKLTRTRLEQDSNKTPIKTVKPDNSRQNTTIPDKTRQYTTIHDTKLVFTILCLIFICFFICSKNLKLQTLALGYQQTARPYKALKSAPLSKTIKKLEDK